MTKGRLEGFSDGVIAVALTIMVLELHPPHGADVAALRELLPKFASYVLSFVYVGIYWNNHHHLFQAVQKVDGAVLWANLHLLFWLTLTPLATAWMSESGFAPWPVAFYGVNLVAAGTAYYILVRALIHRHGPESALARAIGSDLKSKISVVIYAVAVGLAFALPILSLALYALVVAVWLVPDQRMGLAAGGG